MLSRGAVHSVVDQILASPHFGERWARHWLDQARYADSLGYEKDSVKKDAWQYRDWVVQAFNADMPFDRFSALQLAGDLIDPENPQALLPPRSTCRPSSTSRVESMLRKIRSSESSIESIW